MRVHLHRSARQQPIQLKASSATAVRQPVIPFQMHCVHHRKHVIVDVSSSSSSGGGGGGSGGSIGGGAPWRNAVDVRRVVHA